MVLQSLYSYPKYLKLHDLTIFTGCIISWLPEKVTELTDSLLLYLETYSSQRVK